MQESSTAPQRVALYARVSTEEQRDGQTIDSQVAELTKFASEKDWSIARIYKDDGWSGSLLARPNLDRLRDDCSKSLIDIVLINDVDRLARDVSHLGIIKRELERQQIQLVFKKLPAENSPTHNLMVNILGSFAEFERELITDRMRRGRRHKVEIRKQYVGCPAPFGYRYTPTLGSQGASASIRIIPEEARIVLDIYSLAMAGVAMEKIAERITQRGIPSPRGRPRWQVGTINRILRNEMYSGVWCYGRRESVEPRYLRVRRAYRRVIKSGRRLRPKAEWLRIVLPPELKIMEPAFWQQVQDRIAQNQRFSRRNAKISYLLKGLVRCGSCLRAFIGNTSSYRGKAFTLPR
jgi:site-specific DNA recombinase